MNQILGGTAGLAFPAGKATAVVTCHRHVPKSRLSSHESAIKKWLGRLDSNQRMEESKSSALPLGYAPMSKSGVLCPYMDNALRLQRIVKGFQYGVSDGSRTHGLQSHNLTL